MEFSKMEEGISLYNRIKSMQGELRELSQQESKKKEELDLVRKKIEELKEKLEAKIIDFKKL